MVFLVYLVADGGVNGGEFPQTSDLLGTFTTDCSGKQRAEPVPPEPNRFVADFDATSTQKILHVSKRKWKPDVHRDRQTDDLGVTVKALERICFRHVRRLQNHPATSTQILLTRPSIPLSRSNLPLTDLVVLEERLVLARLRTPVLVRGIYLSPQFCRGVPRPARIIEHSPRKSDCIGVALIQDRFRM